MEQRSHHKGKAKTKKRTWLRAAFWIVVSLVSIFVVGIVSVSVYVKRNKAEVLASVTDKLNENLDGTLSIGDLSPEFWSDFPRVSLRLSNVRLRDKRFGLHKHEFLNASRIDVTINALALFSNTIQIKKIAISDASVFLFVDKKGYSNASIFKKKKREKGSGSAMECNQFSLENVKFTAENQMRFKRHEFEIVRLKGKIETLDKGWQSAISFRIFARQMSFNTARGSFIKNRELTGTFDVASDGDGAFTFAEQPLKIGNENFSLGAKLDFGEHSSKYRISIKNKSILWKNAANLLADNIRDKLLLFDLSKPISVSCNLEGDFDIADDPLLYIEAKVRNNTLATPGGTIENCSFDGTFANNYNKKKPLSDANSVILLRDLSGEYGSVPFSMPVAAIANLDDPIAKGKFASNFDVRKLNGLIDKSLVEFKSGRANVSVDFTAAVVDNQLARPKIVGKVSVSRADIAYTRKNLEFKDVSVNLDFNPDNLYIRNIHIKSGQSDVIMDGKIENFLNLYYSSPQKLVLNWNVYSKQLHLGEFVGYLSSRDEKRRDTKRKGNFTSELNELFEKSQVRMAMKIDKLYFKKFHATDATAVIAISGSRIDVSKTGLRHAGGRLSLSGSLIKNNAYNTYDFSAVANQVDVKRFFEAFDNFGLDALRAENLSGKLSLNATLSGAITPANKLVQQTMNGKASFELKDGALANFEPIQRVGKIAFRRRDIKNIAFQDLNGTFTIQGEKVTIEPMKISSSVLNLDVEGVYSFGSGTNLRINVPLRNPKKDVEISDAEELEKRRHRGIVLHLLAADDPETGKVKISLKRNDGGKD